MLTRALRAIWTIRWSVAGFLAALSFSFGSFGLSGAVLHVAASPLLDLAYPPLGEWRGPWVWPVLVGVTIAWAPSFLVAGIVTRILAGRGFGRTSRWLCYLAILWIGAVLAWFLVLAGTYPPGGRN